MTGNVIIPNLPDIPVVDSDGFASQQWASFFLEIAQVLGGGASINLGAATTEAAGLVRKADANPDVTVTATSSIGTAVSFSPATSSITISDATTATGTYDDSQINEIVLLANDTKAKHNALVDSFNTMQATLNTLKDNINSISDVVNNIRNDVISIQETLNGLQENLRDSGVLE